VLAHICGTFQPEASALVYNTPSLLGHGIGATHGINLMIDRIRATSQRPEPRKRCARLSPRTGPQPLIQIKKNDDSITEF